MCLVQSQIQAVTYDDQEVATANINWAKCEDFSPQVGIDQIEEFVAVSFENFWSLKLQNIQT